MKLVIINKKGKKEELNVDFFSFLKCSTMSYVTLIIICSLLLILVSAI